MATNTATYSFLLPTVGGDTNLWGGYLNTNIQAFEDLFDGTTPVTGIDINSGSIDGTPIGAAAASTGAFTTLTAVSPTFTDLGITGDITVGGTVDGVNIAEAIPAAFGTAKQVLTVNAAGTAGEWVPSFVGYVFDTYAAAVAGTPDPAAKVIWVGTAAGSYLVYEGDGTATALTTADAQTWRPARAFDTYLQHYGVETYSTRTLAFAALAAMSGGEQTANQAALAAAFADTVGVLLVDGWAEAIDEVIVGNACTPDLIGGIAGEALLGGLCCVGTRMNLSANSVVTAGATGVGSYAPYIKALSISFDQQPAEDAAQAAYDVAYGVAYTNALNGTIYSDAYTIAYDAAILAGDTVGEADTAGIAAGIAASVAAGIVAGKAAGIPAFAGAIIDYPIPLLGKEAFGLLETARITGATKPATWTAPSFISGNTPDNIGGWEIQNLQLSGFNKTLLIENGFHFLKLGRVDDWVIDLDARAQEYRDRDITAGVKRVGIQIGRVDNLLVDFIGAFGACQIVMDKGQDAAITDQIGAIQLDGDGCSFRQISGRTQIGLLYGTENVASPNELHKVKLESGYLTVGQMSLVGDALAQVEIIGGEFRLLGGRIRQTSLNRRAVHVHTTGQAILSGTTFIKENVAWNVGLVQVDDDAASLIITDCQAENFGIGPANLFGVVKFNNTNASNFIDSHPLTRAGMVTAIAGDNAHKTVLKGSEVYSLDGYQYLANSTETTIVDLLGLVPLDEVFPDHYKTNTTPGTTEMGLAVQAALDYGQAAIYLRNKIYLCSTDVVVPDGADIIGTSSANTDVNNSRGSTLLFAGTAGMTSLNAGRHNMRDLNIIATATNTVTHLFDGTDMLLSNFQNVHWHHRNPLATKHAFRVQKVAGGGGSDVAWSNSFTDCHWQAEGGYSCDFGGSDSYFTNAYFSDGLGARIWAAGNVLTNVHTERSDGDGLCVVMPTTQTSGQLIINGLYADLNVNGLAFEGGTAGADTTCGAQVIGYNARTNTTDIIFRNVGSNDLAGCYVDGYTTDLGATGKIVEEAGTGTLSGWQVREITPTGTIWKRQTGSVVTVTDAGMDVIGNITLTDGDNIYLGTDDDLQLGHSGGAALIDNLTGNFTLRNLSDNGNMAFQSDNGSGGVTNYFVAHGSSGEFRAYFYGIQKFNTKTDGVAVTGDVELLTTGQGIKMRSPDGTVYVLTIANGGTVVVT
jgi:hypothetical protein